MLLQVQEDRLPEGERLVVAHRVGIEVSRCFLGVLFVSLLLVLDVLVFKFDRSERVPVEELRHVLSQVLSRVRK